MDSTAVTTENQVPKTKTAEPRSSQTDLIVRKLEGRLFTVNQTLVKEQVQEQIKSSMEDFIPTVKWRIEDRLDRAVDEIKAVAEPLAGMLSDRIAEVDLLLRSRSREDRVATEDLNKTRQALAASLEKMSAGVEATQAEMSRAIKELLTQAQQRAIDPLKVERLTFWQIMGSVLLGAAAVSLGHAVTNSRHDKVVRDAIIDAAW